MGGGGFYPYPRNVWSPAGGWWCNPKAWKSNTRNVTVLAISIVGGFSYWAHGFQTSRAQMSKEPWTSKQWMGETPIPNLQVQPTSWPRQGLKFEKAGPGQAPTVV